MTTIRRLRRAWQALAGRVRPVRDPDAHLDAADAEFWHPGPGDDTAPLLPVVPPPAPAWDPLADTEAVPVLVAPPPVAVRITILHPLDMPAWVAVVPPGEHADPLDPLTDWDPRSVWDQTPIFGGVLLDAGLIALPAGEPEAAPDVIAAIDRLLEADRRLEEATADLVEATAALVAPHPEDTPGRAVEVAR
jgi:hypothetical protein